MGAVPRLSDFQYTILSGNAQCIFYIGYDGEKNTGYPCKWDVMANEA